MTSIDLQVQNDSAFALYKHENPESVAESWETVGLPIVLEYRTKANVILWHYLSAAKADLPSREELLDAAREYDRITEWRDANSFMHGVEWALSLLGGGE